MTNTFSFISQRNVLVTFFLAGFFFLAGINTTNAQQLARGTDNPYPEIAESFDVTAYELDHFDRAHVIEVLEEIFAPLRHLHGGGTHEQELQFAYLSGLIPDIKGLSVSTSISLLTRLEELKGNKHLVGQMNTTQMDSMDKLRDLYIQTVNAIQ